MISIKWIGAAGVEFNTADKTVLVDPYITRIPKSKIFFGRPLPNYSNIKHYLKTLEKPLKGIVVSHTHFDHALDIPFIAGQVDEPIIGSKSLDNLFCAHNMPDRVSVCAHEKQAFKIGGDIQLTMLPAEHGRVVLGRIPYQGEIEASCERPMKTKDYRVGDVFIPVLACNDTSIMHIGSAGYKSEVLDGLESDILLLCVPGWKRKKGYIEQVMDLVKPDVVMPIHFDDFTRPVNRQAALKRLPFLDMEGFLSCIRRAAPKTRIILPEMFREYFF